MKVFDMYVEFLRKEMVRAILIIRERGGLHDGGDTEKL